MHDKTVVEGFGAGGNRVSAAKARSAPVSLYVSV